MGGKEELAKTRTKTKSGSLVRDLSGNYCRAGKLERLSSARQRLSEELDFFWKRATYFSVILGFIIAAMGSVFGKGDKGLELEQNIALLCWSLLGLLVSTCWYFANRGGKFWYERWENIVDVLEVDLYGTRLYKSDSENPIEKSEEWLSGSKYSVTKIAIYLSLCMILVFAITAIPPFKCLLDDMGFKEPNCSKVIAVASVFLITVFCVEITSCFTKSK